MTAINSALSALSAARTNVETEARIADVAAFITVHAERLARWGGDAAEAHSALSQIARAVNEGQRALDRESCPIPCNENFTKVQSEALRQLVLADSEGTPLPAERLLAFATEGDMEWLVERGWAWRTADGWQPTPSGVRLVWSVD